MLQMVSYIIFFLKFGMIMLPTYCTGSFSNATKKSQEPVILDYKKKLEIYKIKLLFLLNI